MPLVGRSRDGNVDVVAAAGDDNDDDAVFAVNAHLVQSRCITNVWTWFYTVHLTYCGTL